MTDRKKCNVCKKLKPLSSFNKRLEKGREDKPKFRCKTCDTEYQREYRERNRKKHYEAGRRRKEERKRWFNEVVKNKPCVDCGGSFPSCCMDFDHKPGFEKKATLATLVGDGYPEKTILEEVAKCDIVCANCHRIRTRDRGWNQWDKCKKRGPGSGSSSNL